MYSLLIIVIFEDLVHEFLDLYFLFLDHAVNDGLHPGEISVDVHALLAFDILCAV